MEKNCSTVIETKCKIIEHNSQIIISTSTCSGIRLLIPHRFRTTYTFLIFTVDCLLSFKEIYHTCRTENKSQYLSQLTANTEVSGRLVRKNPCQHDINSNAVSSFSYFSMAFMLCFPLSRSLSCSHSVLSLPSFCQIYFFELSFHDPVSISLKT